MNYEIVMEESAYRKMRTLTELASTEIAALGYCEPKMYADSKTNGYLYVSEIFLVPQEVSGSEVDFINEGLQWATQKALKEDRVNELRFCFHSHVNMGAFWSGTDEDMIEKIAVGGTPWFASVVTNKKGDMKGRIDVFKGPLPGLGQITTEADVVSDSILDMVDECRAEIKEHVKKSSNKWQHWNKQDAKDAPKGKGKSKAPAKDKSRKGKGKALQPFTKPSADDIADVDAMLPTWLALHQQAEKHGWDTVTDTDGWVIFVEKANGTDVTHGTAPTLDALHALFPANAGGVS